MLRFGLAIALLAALAGAFLFAASASAGSGGAGFSNWQPVPTSRTSVWRYLDKSQIRVIDGDTLAYHGGSIRLLDLQAPELHRVCAEEIAVGLQSKARFEALLAAGKAVRAGFLYRKNRAGQTVRATDKYGRLLATILIDRQDVGALLIGEGLAKNWDGHGPKPSWCAP